MDYGKSSKNVFLPSSVLKAFIKVSPYKWLIIANQRLAELKIGGIAISDF